MVKRVRTEIPLFDDCSLGMTICAYNCNLDEKGGQNETENRFTV